MVFNPIEFMYLIPSASPTIPGRLCVPHSNLSGKKSGCFREEERLPVPPCSTLEQEELNLESNIKPPKFKRLGGFYIERRYFDVRFRYMCLLQPNSNG